jgi:hypothetical protein
MTTALGLGREPFGRQWTRLDFRKAKARPTLQTPTAEPHRLQALQDRGCRHPVPQPQ